MRPWPVLFAAVLLFCSSACGQVAGTATPAKSLAAALPPEKWSQLQNSVDRALAWIATQQSADGSFPTSVDTGQPAVTSLCVMAFLSRGHQPGLGPYGSRLDRAIDFVLSCQREDGLFSYVEPEPFHVDGPSASHTAAYNHSISGLMLGEVYGHVTGARGKKIKTAIAKALKLSRALQTRSKPNPSDEGGTRYLHKKPNESDSDMSLTAWQLMFYRSAKNAEFTVPQQFADDAIAYVYRCWDPRLRMFNYIAFESNGGLPSRAMTGAGILSLSLAGQHDSPIARSAGDWLVAHPYGRYGQTIGQWDQYIYSTYYCSQAAAQLGGRYWEKIFPPIVNMFLKVQSPDGYFPPDVGNGDTMFGQVYSSALAVLALTPAYQLLPVYQR
jgi:hypothetical protein